MGRVWKPSALAQWLQLAELADPETGRVHGANGKDPTRADLAKIMQIHPGTMTRHLAELKAAGALTAEGDNGGTMALTVHLPPPPGAHGGAEPVLHNLSTAQQLRVDPERQRSGPQTPNGPKHPNRSSPTLSANAQGGGDPTQKRVGTLSANAEGGGDPERKCSGFGGDPEQKRVGTLSASAQGGGDPERFCSGFGGDPTQKRVGTLSASAHPNGSGRIENAPARAREVNTKPRENQENSGGGNFHPPTVNGTAAAAAGCAGEVPWNPDPSDALVIELGDRKGLDIPLDHPSPSQWTVRRLGRMYTREYVAAQLAHVKTRTAKAMPLNCGRFIGACRENWARFDAGAAAQAEAKRRDAATAKAAKAHAEQAQADAQARRVADLRRAIEALTAKQARALFDETLADAHGVSRQVAQEAIRRGASIADALCKPRYFAIEALAERAHAIATGAQRFVPAEAV